MGDLNSLLSSHAASYPDDRVPPALAASLVRNLTDGLAAIIGGSRAPGVGELAVQLEGVARAGSARRFAVRGEWPALITAQLNATAGHALDFDDTLDEGGGMHAGALVHSAALAVADELGNVSGARYLSAVAVGLDIAVRLALSATQDFGWHRTSAFGVFGVVGAVGRLLGLDAGQFEHAFGIAYSQASGNRQCIADGALSKRLQAGFAARDGILAVQLARAGVTGATRAFEGADGFFNLYQRGQYRRETITDGLGEVLLADRISLKPYPCGRNLHALVDAVLRARELHAGRKIVHLEVHVPERAVRNARSAWPSHVVEAQFSIPFVAALATATGRTDLSAFDAPSAVAPEVRELGERVVLVAHAGGDASDQVVFRYADGSEQRAPVSSVAIGNPALALPLTAVQDKLRAANVFAGSPLSAERVERLLALVEGFTGLADTRQVTQLLAAD